MSSHAFDDLLGRLDYMRVLQDLNPRDRGNKIIINCPKCSDKEAYIFKETGQSIICRSMNKCGATTTLIEYTCGSRHPTGSDFVEAAKRLADLGGTTYDIKPMSAEKRKEHDQHVERKSALLTFRDWARQRFVSVLNGFAEHPAISYLESRKFKADTLAAAGFGLLENIESLQGVLTLGQAQSLGLANQKGNWISGWSGRILIPLSDRYGRFAGFSGRAYGIDQEPKYLNTKGVSLKDTIATELKSALEDSKRLVAVEGYLDPFKARQHAIGNVIAIGSTGNAFSPERWAALADYGVEELTLLLDGDKAGQAGLIKALQNRDKARRKPATCVAVLSGAKDLDEYLDRYGVQAYAEIYAARLPVDRYRAQSFAVGLDLTREADQWHYLKTCMEYDQGIKDTEHQISLERHFWTEVTRLVGSVEPIMDARNKLRDEKRAKQTQIELTKLLADVHATNQKDPIAALDKLKTVDFQNLGIPAGYASPVCSPDEQLRQDGQWLLALASQEYLGLPQRVLPTLDRFLSGLHGLILVAGQTNTGKTTFLAQTSLEVIRQNPDACFLFLSLELHPRVIRSRMVAYLAGMTFRQVVSANNARNPPDMRVKRAEKQLRTLLERARFLHYQDTPGFICSERNIISEIADLKLKTGCKRCIVVLDYIDLYPIDENRFKTDVAQDKERMEVVIRIRDANERGALLAVTEVRKLEKGQVAWLTADDLIGSTRKGYRAESVIILNRLDRKRVAQLYECDGWNAPALRATPLEGSKVDMEDHIWKHWQKWAVTLGISPININIAKAKDDGTIGDFNCLSYWKHYRITENMNFEQPGEIFTENTYSENEQHSGANLEQYGYSDKTGEGESGLYSQRQPEPSNNFLL